MALSQEAMAYKYPSSIAKRVTCSICALRCRVVAEKGDNLRTRLRANLRAIVFPFLHSLIRYAKHMSHLNNSHLPVNPRLAQMLAKRLRVLQHLPPQAAI